MEYSQDKTQFVIFQHPFPSFENSKLKTEELLTFSKGVLSLVELFGKVFKPVYYDMNGNVQKILKRYEQDVEKHMYVEDMLLFEQREGNLLATDALMWLRRGMHFMAHFFQILIVDIEAGNYNEDLTVLFREAYKHTLERYHGWMGSNLFKLVCKCAPTRTQLIQRMSLVEDIDHAAIRNDIKIFAQDLHSCVQHLHIFYISNKLEVSYKV